MSITPFTLQGKHFVLDTEKRLITGEDKVLLAKIQRRIEQCQAKGSILDNYPTGGKVLIDDPYGDEYQFAICLFAAPEDVGEDAEILGIPSESLRQRLYGELLEHELLGMSAEERIAYDKLREGTIY